MTLVTVSICYDRVVREPAGKEDAAQQSKDMWVTEFGEHSAPLLTFHNRLKWSLHNTDTGVEAACVPRFIEIHLILFE